MIPYLSGMHLAFIIAIMGAMPSNAMQGRCCDTTGSSIVIREFGFTGAGLSWLNIENVNEFLESQGVTSFKSISPTFSLGGHREIRRLVMESNLTLHYWRDNLNADLRTSLFAGEMVWNNGINILPAALPVTAYPYVGLGFGIAAMHFRSKEKSFAQLKRPYLVRDAIALTICGYHYRKICEQFIA